MELADGVLKCGMMRHCNLGAAFLAVLLLLGFSSAQRALRKYGMLLNLSCLIIIILVYTIMQSGVLHINVATDVKKVIFSMILERNNS